MTFDFIQKIFIWLIPLVFAITIHEAAHGWVAYKCGDPTAKMLGRITLNPIKHIDIWGTIIIPIILLLLSGGRFTFGYAKPVPVDWRNLKHPRRDMALVAFAGPLSNLIMALIWALIAKGGYGLAASSVWVAQIIFAIGMSGILINLVIGVLNLLPIPPLDGSRVVTSFLSAKAAAWYNSIEQYGFFILIALIATGILGKIMFPIIDVLYGMIAGMVGLR